MEQSKEISFGQLASVGYKCGVFGNCTKHICLKLCMFYLITTLQAP